MAKKQYTPEEFKAKTEKSAANKENFSKVFLSSIAVMLALVITFSVVSIAFTFVGKAGQTTVVSGQVNNGGSTNVDNSGSNNDATALNVVSDTPQGQINKQEILTGKYASGTTASENAVNINDETNQNQSSQEQYTKHFMGKD